MERRIFKSSLDGSNRVRIFIPIIWHWPVLDRVEGVEGFVISRWGGRSGGSIMGRARGHRGCRIDLEVSLTVFVEFTIGN
jgi:hypothetical protein